MENDKFGNISFGETTKLLVNIIGQDAILSLIPDDEQQAFKKKLSRAYKDEVNFSGLATKEKDNPQDYAKLFFDELEVHFKIPDFAYNFIDWSTWQLFHSCLSHTPFEKKKTDTVKYLLRRQFFHSIHDFYLPQFGKDLLVFFLARTYGLPNTYKTIFDEAAKKITGGNLDSLFVQINDFTDKKSNEENISLNGQKIRRWDNGIKATWKSIKPLLNFFYDKKQSIIAYRLIAVYLIENGKKAFDDLNLLSKNEFDKIMIDLVTMLIEDKKPEEFYDETFGKEDSIEYHNLLGHCLLYIKQPNLKELNKFQELEELCPNSKKFFSPWLKAKMELISLKNSLSNDYKKIREYYKKAFDEGKYYIGCFMRQFLLEAIILEKNNNIVHNKNLNDYYAFGYALEIFTPDINQLLGILDGIKHMDQIEQFELIEMFCGIWNEPLINKPDFTTEPFLKDYLNEIIIQ